MNRSNDQNAVPAWALAAFEAPSRYADIAALRQRIVAEPYRVLSRIVPEIDASAAFVGADDPWKTSVLRALFRTWLEHEPDATKRTKSAAKAQADRAAAVAKAAEALLAAVASARMGLDACRVEGIEPVLLSSGLDELEMGPAVPVIEALLAAARRRSVVPTRQGGYASVATLTAHLDAATASLGFTLSEAAAADFFELADRCAKRTYTEEAIRKARARTIRV